MIFLFVEENLSSSVYKKVHHSESIFFFMCVVYMRVHVLLFSL
jgi:hypothetical protein